MATSQRSFIDVVRKTAWFGVAEIWLAMAMAG